MSGRCHFTGCRRFSGDRLQPLHRVWQMREKMSYEGNGTNRRRQTINRLEKLFNCYASYFHSIQTKAWRAVVPYRHSRGNTLCNKLYSFICSDVASLIGNNERCIMGGVFRTCQNISICSIAHFRNCRFDSH